jgi:hypothetical protein
LLIVAKGLSLPEMKWKDISNAISACRPLRSALPETQLFDAQMAWDERGMNDFAKNVWRWPTSLPDWSRLPP